MNTLRRRNGLHDEAFFTTDRSTKVIKCSNAFKEIEIIKLIEDILKNANVKYGVKKEMYGTVINTETDSRFILSNVDGIYSIPGIDYILKFYTPELGVYEYEISSKVEIGVNKKEDRLKNAINEVINSYNIIFIDDITMDIVKVIGELPDFENKIYLTSKDQLNTDIPERSIIVSKLDVNDVQQDLVSSYLTYLIDKNSKLFIEMSWTEAVLMAVTESNYKISSTALVLSPKYGNTGMDAAEREFIAKCDIKDTTLLKCHYNYVSSVIPKMISSKSVLALIKEEAFYYVEFSNNTLDLRNFLGELEANSFVNCNIKRVIIPKKDNHALVEAIKESIKLAINQEEPYSFIEM